MIWYGLHFAEGVAQYLKADGSFEMVFISDETARKMNESFSKKPVYIDHPDSKDIDINKVHEVDGWVIESFYNKADGKHWVKFLTVTQEAKNAIEQGYKLSNAYIPTNEGGPSGEWHGVPYSRQITDAEYEHLAIVKEPKYSESVILTEEEFLQYNAQKHEELGNRFVNKKTEQGESSMFKFFKNSREEVKEGLDVKTHSVILPKSKKEMSLEKIINAIDDIEVERSQNPDMFCSGDEKVKLGEKVLTVNELIKEYQTLCEKNKAENEDEVDEEVEEELDEDEVVDNEDASEETEDKKKNSKENFDRLVNADKTPVEKFKVLELGMDQTARGKLRYGSKVR